MQNKFKNILVATVMLTLVAAPVMAAEEDAWAEEMSADAVAEYNMDGSVFQQITGLEQEKLLMQLEKERAQLDLDLDRLAAEKIKLHMEIDTLSGRAEQQQQELETERAKLETEAAKLEREREALMNNTDNPTAAAVRAPEPAAAATETSVSKKYRLVDIIGAGKQLQATVENKDNGQRRKISVGRMLDGYTIRSISLDDGVVFTKDGKSEALSMGSEK